MSNAITVVRKDLESFCPNLRVVKAFEALFQTPQSITDNSAEIASLTTNVTDLTSEVDMLSLQVSNLSDQLTTINEEILSLETALALTNDNVALVSTGLETLTTYVYANIPPDYGTY